MIEPSLALDLRACSKTYDDGTCALKSIDLKVNHGDFYALLGKNGAGKTTCLNIITGLTKKTSGHVTINGLDIDTQRCEASRQIGIVAQEFNCGIFLKVEQILRHAAGYYGLTRADTQRRIREVINMLGLSAYRCKPFGQLSGGYKRRVMIAAAIMHKPKLLFLDEPTAGIDIETRHMTWDLLTQLNNEDCSIVLTTHYLEEAEKLCNRLAIIHNGTIIYENQMTHLKTLCDQHQQIIFETHQAIPKKLELDCRYINMENHQICVTVQDHQDITKTSKQLAKQGLMVIGIKPQLNRLEHLFLSLTHQSS